MMIKPVVLWTDFLFYVLLAAIIGFAWWARGQTQLRLSFGQVMRRPLAVVSLLILLVYGSIGFLDSLHYRQALPGNGPVHYSTQIKSALDWVLSPIDRTVEKTYSAPFSLHLFVKETVLDEAGKAAQVYPHLKYVPQSVQSISMRNQLIIKLVFQSAIMACLIWTLVSALLIIFLKNRWGESYAASIKMIAQNKRTIPWRLLLITFLVLMVVLFVLYGLSREFHVFGTGKVGQDVFYQAVKSIRTGLMIGTLTTLIMLPFALFLGIAAGFFGGLADDIIQYVYTTLSSIPGVLLIAAAILSLQIYIANHLDLFPTLEQRADARLLALCAILGVTSWTGLCRLLRAETLKSRELDFIAAATALGVSRFKIIWRHILPNVMHIVFITVVLDFSGLVLAEAVLSYVGVGVSPTTISWGNMINSARLELAREPVVWWPIFAAFSFMFALVLAANLFADAVRDAFDPRLRKH
jgi:peptide/nickel transport system permease protein